MRLDLEYAQLASLDGLERFRWLRSLTLYNVRGLAGVRAIEQLEGLRDLRICTDEPGLAHAVCELDLSRFPQLQRLARLPHRRDAPARHGVDTGCRDVAARARIGRFAPLSGAYDDFAAATRLVQLDVSSSRLGRHGTADVPPLDDGRVARPHRNQKRRSVYPFDLIWDFLDRRGGFSMSPSLADAWGVDNESDAQDHLISLVDEHDAGLLRRVEFDSELEFMQINATSRYDLEEVLKVATRATSARFQHHVWRTVEGLPYTVLPVDGREIPPCAFASDRVVRIDACDRGVVWTRAIQRHRRSHGRSRRSRVVSRVAGRLGLWYADDAPDAAAKTADLAIRDAFHRLAVRVARGIPLHARVAAGARRRCRSLERRPRRRPAAVTRRASSVDTTHRAPTSRWRGTSPLTVFPHDPRETTVQRDGGDDHR